MARNFKIPSVEYQEPVSIDNADIYGGAQYFQQTRSVRVGAGGKGFRSTVEDGIWLGAEKFADAPFSVTPAGFLKATGVNISGTITATSGFIGGWQINPTTLSASGNKVILDSAGKITAGVAGGQRVLVDGTTNRLEFFKTNGLTGGIIQGGTAGIGGDMVIFASGTPPSELDLLQGRFTLQQGTFILDALGNDFTLDIGALRVWSINAVTQDFLIHVDLVPNSTAGSRNLGISGQRWKDLFISGNLNIGGGAIISGDSVSRTINRHWVPESSAGNRQLGTVTNAWRYLYLSDGTSNWRVEVDPTGALTTTKVT